MEHRWNQWKALALGGVVAVLVLGLVVLRFGNPQWSKYIYIFQAYVSPATEEVANRLSTDYTGRAFFWYRDGTKYVEMTYKGGQMHGKYREWCKDGTVWLEGYFKHGKQHGEFVNCFDGVRRNVVHYEDGVRHGTWTEYDEKGKVVSITTYEHGKEVKTP